MKLQPVGLFHRSRDFVVQWNCGLMGLALALLVGGCEAKRSDGFVLQKVGDLAPDKAGNILEDTFYVHKSVDRWSFGIAIPNRPQQTPADATLAMQMISPLRLRLELFHGRETNSFYRAEFGLASDSAYYPLWQPDFGVLVGGGLEFPFNWPAVGEHTAQFRDGRDIFPFHRGRLAPNQNYRMRLTALAQATLTNRLDIWLYGVTGQNPDVTQ